MQGGLLDVRPQQLQLPQRFWVGLLVREATTWLLLCSSAGAMRHCRKERPCEKFQRLTEASRLPVSSSQGWCGLHIITCMVVSACG